MKVKSLYPTIVSGNVEELMKFYAALGFTQKHDLTTKLGSHVYVIANGDLEIEIIEAVKDGPVPLPNGLYGFRVNVDDVDAAADTVKQNGGTIIAGPVDTLASKSLITKDADGNNVTFIQHIK